MATSPINSVSRNRDGSALYVRIEEKPCRPDMNGGMPITIIRRALRSADGSWRMWTYYEGENKGAPLRGKNRQQQIAQFAADVQAAIDAAD